MSIDPQPSKVDENPFLAYAIRSRLPKSPHARAIRSRREPWIIAQGKRSAALGKPHQKFQAPEGRPNSKNNSRPIDRSAANDLRTRVRLTLAAFLFHSA